MTSKLKKGQITILSKILEIDENSLLFLSKRKVLNYSVARNILIKSDYEEMLRTGMLNKNIIASLSVKYKLSKSSIEKVIYRNNE